MKKQAITAEQILNKLKPGFKNAIVEMMSNALFSKQMIRNFRFIPEPQLSEYFKELLEEKKIFEVGVYYCNVSKTEQLFYGAEKIVTLFTSFRNGK